MMAKATKKKVTGEVEPALIKRIKVLCAKMELTQAELIQKALEL